MKHLKTVFKTEVKKMSRNNFFSENELIIFFILGPYIGNNTVISASSLEISEILLQCILTLTLSCLGTPAIFYWKRGIMRWLYHMIVVATVYHMME